jgi:prepilin-type N-terminal cleavage/methylation domain-containing protein
MTSRKNRGYSLLELMIVIGIGLTMAGISFIAMMPLLNKSHLDTAYDTTLMALRNTRHLAITQSHQYILTFDPTAGTITVQYQGPADPTTGIVPAAVLVNTYTLPSDVSFAVQGGFPATTPDGFGTGNTAVDFGYLPIGGTGGSHQVVFMPDGSSRDTVGNYNSGVLYLTRPTADKYSSRAITVWGATGRVRGWRLYPQSGGTWIQQ